MKNILFIMNPISGTQSKAGIPEVIEKKLDKTAFSYSIAYTERPGHATEMALRAAAQGIDIVVAVGGDGTVNEVGRGLLGTRTAMAILPCGSGNGLARHLMLPMNAGKAVEIINYDEVHDLDYGLINGHPFFCTCGMGFDAFISMKFAEAGKRGPITYVEKVLKDGLSYKPETYEIEDESGKKLVKAFLLTCANASQYGNNVFIAPQASMSDGLLDVIVIKPFDIIEAPQVALELFNKTIDMNTKVQTFKARNIHVHRAMPGLIHFDGDPLMTDADVNISVVHKGIKVVVNPYANKAERKPNAVQTAFSEMFCDMDMIRETIIRKARQMQSINKTLMRRLHI